MIPTGADPRDAYWYGRAAAPDVQNVDAPAGTGTLSPYSIPSTNYAPTNDPATYGSASLWDQLAANILLTAQALQQLHHAFDQRFTR